MKEYDIGISDPLFFIGVIENNVDPRLEGRVQVRAFNVHGTNKDIATEDLPWAIVVSGNYLPDFLPPINSWVFGTFLDGRSAQHPMILGLIPTQFTEEFDPEVDGWGWIGKGMGVLAQGSRAKDFGNPQNSNLSRGENLTETYVLEQEMNRKLNQKVAGSEDTIDEPGSAYNAQYPYNKVIETANHSIEIDDTPGGERIMIWHKEGSYVQIDSRGTVTEKSVSDKYEVIDRKQHVIVGGSSVVTINGNSHVYVKGNKIEEVEGDLKTLVHGNYMLSVGGSETVLNGSENMQLRAGDVKVEANAGTLSLKANKEMQLSSGNLGFPYGAISIKSEKILVDATDKLHMRGNTQVNVQSIAEMNLSAVTINQLSADWNSYAALTSTLSSGLTTDITGTIDVAIGGGSQVNVNAGFVNIDNFVNMANGLARTPISSATIAPSFIPDFTGKPFIPGSGFPEIAWAAAAVKAPEPVSKSTSISGKTEGSLGSAGAAAQDHDGSDE